MIKLRHNELKYVPNTTFSSDEFEKQKVLFLKNLKKNVDSYFYVTHEKFEIRVFKVFKKEFNNYIDFFLKNKDNLTRIKLIKRNHEIFVRESLEKAGEQRPPALTFSEELENDLKELDYLDNPQNLWNDLDTRVKNMFVERYIGESTPYTITLSRTSDDPLYVQ
jgi:hypothetical protein